MSLRLNGLEPTNDTPPVLEHWGAIDAVTNGRRNGVREGRCQPPSRTKASSAASRRFVPVPEYTIAAIPTIYRGRMYRSRLEARWAAFFDRLGWTHEYEPFDLGKWSPDFAITDPFEALIEVKPLTEADPDLFDRVQNAGRCAVFVMRVAPILIADSRMVEIGWWAASYQPVTVAWRRDPESPGFVADILSFTSDLTTWITCTQGHGKVGEEEPEVHGYTDHTMRLWSDACNAVQWEPTR